MLFFAGSACRRQRRQRRQGQQRSRWRGGTKKPKLTWLKCLPALCVGDCDCVCVCVCFCVSVSVCVCVRFSSYFNCIHYVISFSRLWWNFKLISFVALFPSFCMPATPPRLPPRRPKLLLWLCLGCYFPPCLLYFCLCLPFFCFCFCLLCSCLGLSPSSCCRRTFPLSELFKRLACLACLVLPHPLTKKANCSHS